MTRSFDSAIHPCEELGAGRKSLGWGFNHKRSPHAILAPSIVLTVPATGRDIAKTVYAMLGVSPPEPLPEGRSLVP